MGADFPLVHRRFPTLLSEAVIRVPLDEALVCSDERSKALVLLDQALSKLATFGPRQGKIVELRFFGGMSTKEIAAVLGIGERTVDRDWKLAQAWLKREIGA